jgi:hypothetical protein
MSCIQCGNTPTVLGAYCLECVQSVKFKQQPSFQPTISPTPTSDAVTEAMRIKREEAINLARGLYGIPTPSAGSLSVPSSMKPPPPPPVHSNLGLSSYVLIPTYMQRLKLFHFSSSAATEPRFSLCLCSSTKEFSLQAIFNQPSKAHDQAIFLWQRSHPTRESSLPGLCPMWI